MTTECSICLDPLEEPEYTEVIKRKISIKNLFKTKPTEIKDDIVHLPCTHSFHLCCLSKVQNNSCPLCRKTLVEESMCKENHYTFYNSSFYKRNGECTICRNKSFKYYLRQYVK